MKPLNILLLCNRPAKNADASTVTDHISSFLSCSKHRVQVLSFLKRLPSRLDLDRFDVIVLHYSIALGFFSDQFIDAPSKRRIGECNALKVVFIQDEYRNVNAAIHAMRTLNTDVLFTCVPSEEIHKVYPEEALPGTLKINTLTGYVPRRLLNMDVPPIKDRPVHVGYRTRKLPYWFGDLGFEKWNIAERFVENTRRHHLNLDISIKESDRIYGPRWIQFNCSCKSVLGVESGANVFDFTGDISRTVDKYQEDHPEADYADVHRMFLEPYDGKIRLNQISPRFFEAAALKTVMVLYEGEYSGILKPWRHFIPLKKDFSNIGQVVEILQDDQKLQEIADRTYAEIAANDAYSYETFIKGFEEIVAGEFRRRMKLPVTRPYSESGFRKSLALSPMYVFHQGVSRLMQRVIMGTRIRKLLYDTWLRLPLRARASLRPLLWIIGR